ncbi:hypothetical protein F383_24733 [Gossypium arboreum]|uniref:Uncharacterized protein n=1 Tax=Gossypium arboreum TaxID=29729 RepID=A0A0B0NYP9_GOSAR|nr:hypothetical protein F383_24733 [Gossypium arboreum]
MKLVRVLEPWRRQAASS